MPRNVSDKEMKNTVPFKGYIYATLDFASPDVATSIGGRSKTPLEIPEGWELAPDDPEIVAEVIAKHGWSTNALVVSNFNGYSTLTLGSFAGKFCDLSNGGGSSIFQQFRNSYLPYCKGWALLVRTSSTIVPKADDKHLAKQLDALKHKLTAQEAVKEGLVKEINELKAKLTAEQMDRQRLERELEKTQAFAKAAAEKAEVVAGLPRPSEEAIEGLVAFLQHLGGNKVETLHEKASSWIKNEEGESIQDVVDTDLCAAFLDALELKSIPLKKAQQYLSDLGGASHKAAPPVPIQVSACEHALMSLGLDGADLSWSPFSAHVEVADAKPHSSFRVAVEDYFANSKFVVKNVRAFNNLFARRGYDAQFEKLRVRRQTASTPFHQNFPYATPKGRLLRRFQRHFGPMHSTGGFANWLLVFHGSMMASAESVVKTGFAALSKLDEGFYGHGIYITPQLEYACRYALGEFGGGVPSDGVGVVIVSLLCIGLVYPVDRDRDYPAGAVPQASSNLMGKPLKTSEGFDAHVAAVDGTTFQAAADPMTAPYLEVVVAQESQILPVALIEFSEC